jgi:hypothetical protein
VNLSLATARLGGVPLAIPDLSAPVATGLERAGVPSPYREIAGAISNLAIPGPGQLAPLFEFAGGQAARVAAPALSALQRTFLGRAAQTLSGEAAAPLEGLAQQGERLYVQDVVPRITELLERIEAAPRSEPLVAATSEQLARTQNAGGLALELDPARLAGAARPAAEGAPPSLVGQAYDVVRSVPGAVRALVTRSERQVPRLAEEPRLQSRFDFAAAQPARGGGVRIPARLPAQAQAQAAVGLAGAVGGGYAGAQTAPPEAGFPERVARTLSGAATGYVGARLALGLPAFVAALRRGAGARELPDLYDRLAAIRNERAVELPGMPREPQSFANRLQAFFSSNLLLGPHSLFVNAATQGENLAREAAIRGVAGYPTEAGRGVRLMAAANGDALQGFLQALLTGRQRNVISELGERAPIGPEALGLRLNVGTDEAFRTLGGAQAMGMELDRLMAANPGKRAVDVIEQNRDLLQRAGERGAARSVFADGPDSGLGAWLSRTTRRLINDPNPLNQARGWLMYAAVPFSRIPETIWQTGIRRSPIVNEALGGTKIVQALRSGDRRAANLAFAETTLDTAINFAIWNATDAGNITAGKDPEHPWSIRLPGNKWVDYRGLGPIAARLGAIASVKEASSEEANRLKPQVLARVLDKTGSMLMNQWYLGSMVGVLDALRTGNVSGALSKFVTQVGDRFVLGSAGLNAVEQMTDPYMRDPSTELPQGLWERQVSRIPGLAQQLPERISTTTGQPQPRPAQSPLEVVLGIQSDVSDPAKRELARLNRLNYSLNPPAETTDTFTVGGSEIALTPPEKRTYLRARGAFVAQGIDYMNSDAYKGYTDDEKARYWQNLVDRSANVGRAAVIESWGGTDSAEFDRRVAQGRRVVGRLEPQTPETTPTALPGTRPLPPPRILPTRPPLPSPRTLPTRAPVTSTGGR